MSREEQDKKNKRFGMIFSAAAHIAVLILFIFLVAWRAPNPPNPEIGIELNFGTTSEGSGDTQPEPFTPLAESESEEDTPENPVEELFEEVIEETVEEVSPPVEETAEEVTENQDNLEEVIPVTNQPTEAPIEKPVEKKQEAIDPPKQEVVEEKPKELPKVLYPGTKDGSANQPKAANQGDKTDKVGDQGDKEGDVDARALYGTPGGGDGGAALDISGWGWNEAPNPNEKTNEEGKIVFEITVDERGEVISAVPVSYTVSISLVKVYQVEVERLTLSKTGSGQAPESTKGRITFVIKTK